MDSIREMLDRIQQLSAEELTTLESSVLSEFDVLDKNKDVTRESVESMQELANAAEALRNEQSRRTAEVAELSAMRDEATARVRGGSEDNAETASKNTPATPAKDDTEPDPQDPNEGAEDPATEVEIDPETGLPVEIDPVTGLPVAKKTPATTAAVEAPAAATVEAEPVAEIQVEAASEPEPEPVLPETPAETTASIEAPAEATASSSVKEEDRKDTEAPVTAAAVQEEGTLEVPEDRRPKASTPVTVSITAGADIPGTTVGSHLPDMRSVADALLRRKNAMGRTSGGDGEQHTVATLTTTYPEDRTLRSNDMQGNADRISRIVSPQAITAAGGLCAPVETSYEIFGLGDLGRPVRDSLAVFSADRGGIRFITPPVLADLSGSVSAWTLQDDIDAATSGAPDPVKPCIRVNCGSEVVVYTDAIPLCLTFGNLGARAWPELVQRHTELGMIWHARYAEQRLITRIGALSTAVSAARVLGAARDFFVQLERAAAAYRNRHRISEVAPLRVILPQWFKNMLRADLVMQLPGDGQDETFNLADSFLNNWFNVRHINVTWHMDGESGQIFGAQAAGALLDFPSVVKWYLFSEGTFLFLDGGTLDLGLVRDSTLNGTNDYKIFLETFEGVAKVGIESLAVTSTLKVTGASAGTVNTNA